MSSEMWAQCFLKHTSCELGGGSLCPQAALLSDQDTGQLELAPASDPARQLPRPPQLAWPPPRAHSQLCSLPPGRDGELEAV